ncbi:DUF6760 family protein [Streptomyces sp. NPDC050504]|uniref:T4 family baseplate hub assembly chaperone n=1 Tax=Streptomyces sp. NPDC050504 TaxID=3365618 RepID=UPI0037B14A54
MRELPGGYWDAEGRLHREVELAALTGREEELLARSGGTGSAALVTEVLSRCVRRIGAVAPVTPDVARRLLVADRQYLLLRLREAAFGDLVRAHFVCPWPECGERVSLEFRLSDVPVTAGGERAPEHTLTLPGDCGDVVFRLPDGSDQEELSELLARNEAEALTGLLARCVRRLGDTGPPDARALAALPSAARAAIEERMALLAPRVEQTMEAPCSECGRTVVAPFDIQRFFFGELRTDSELLYREVHYLAYHYHWSETEIMRLTREKRRRYIDVIAETIEVLNSGA